MNTTVSTTARWAFPQYEANRLTASWSRSQSSIPCVLFEDNIDATSNCTDDQQTPTGDWTPLERLSVIGEGALDTVPIHRVAKASLQIVGSGYQVQLPGAADAGFHVGDRVPCTSAPNLLVIAADESGRVAADIATIRREQV